jgi:hypothetical protein
MGTASKSGVQALSLARKLFSAAGGGCGPLLFVFGPGSVGTLIRENLRDMKAVLQLGELVFPETL